MHFRIGGGATVSLRCSHEPYHKGLDRLLKLDKPHPLTLPGNLAEILERAEVMTSGGANKTVKVQIAPDELTLTSRKDSGWYREKKRISYTGPEMTFEVNPDFLSDVLKRTRDVSLDGAGRRMLIETGNIQFVTALMVGEEKE